MIIDYTEFFALLEIFREKLIQNLPQNAKFDTLLIQIMTMKLLRNQNKSKFTDRGDDAECV